MLKETVLITGVSGLIGGAVANRLAGSGHAVVGIDQKKCPLAVKGTFSFVEADVNDTHRLYATIKAHEPHHIIHCGGISGRVAAGDNPFMLLETNVRGTAQIFEAARNFGIKRVVFCSSAAAYGNRVPDPLTESAPLLATTMYGASKACGEAILRAYAEEHGVDGIALRIFQVYGPRRTTECYIRRIISDALAGRPTHIAHAAHSRRQYVYVDDVVNAVVLALECGRHPRYAYNVAGGSSLTLAEVAEVIRSAFPNLRVDFGSDPAGAQYTIGNVDLSIARAELGYCPKTPLREGILRYAEWLKENGASG